MIANRPPILFVRGNLRDADERAMAVVGTRDASAEGVSAASKLACELAQREVTVVSGLATGIDTAAHSAALNCGGRTLAVFGTGISHVFPAGNRVLANQVARSGACISQFWPAQRGARWTFPLRNIITSGLTQGTAVIEASETSGARLQAHDALRHGKRLFLLAQLVTKQEWAKRLVDAPGVTVVNSVDEILAGIELELCTRAPDLVF
jgi:DNA processing protein